MLKVVLSTIPIVLMTGCGSTNSESTTEPKTEPTATTQPTQTPSETSTTPTNTQKLNQATQSLNLKSTRLKNSLIITSKKESITFTENSYLLTNAEKKQALITLGDDKLEEFEKKEQLVIATDTYQLPTVEQGYKNIFIEEKTTIDEIEVELTNLFQNKGAAILSYRLNDMEKNATILMGGNNLHYQCINQTTEDIFELVLEDSYITLPSNVEGHYICLDEYENKVFDYNLTLEVTDLFGVKYTFDPNTERGASINIYNIIATQVDVESLEKSLKSSNTLKEDEFLKLKVFYRDVLNTESIRKEVLEDEIILLPKGEYELSYTLTSPQNAEVDIDNTLQRNLTIIEEVPRPKLIPN